MGSSASGVPIDPRPVCLLVRTMFPHPGFPDGPYERTAAAIVEAAGRDPRAAAQLSQGLAEMEAALFADLDDHARLEYLSEISGTDFFETVRTGAVTALYGDPEVWRLLGCTDPAVAAPRARAERARAGRSGEPGIEEAA